MKVLFLDIDGVLRTTGHIDILEPALILHLKRIVEETGVKIVLSSDWRKKFLDLKMAEQQLGFFGIEIFDVTPIVLPSLLSSKCRWQEIKEWMKDKEIEKFAIVDDDEDGMIPDNPDTFFFTDWREGLTKEKAEEIINFFAEK